MRASRTTGRLPAAAVGLSLFLAPLVVGCGNLTAGGFGEVEARASADADEANPSPTPVRAVPAGTRLAFAPLPAGAGLLEGVLEAEMRLWLIDDRGSAHALTPNTVRPTLDLDGTVEAVADRRVAPGRYPTLRVLVTELTADVEAGLIVDGVPFLGLATVQLDDGLIVELAIDLDIVDESRHALLVDFNADEWLLDLDPLTHVVAAADVATRIAVVP